MSRLHKSLSSELAAEMALSSREIRKTYLKLTIGSVLGPIPMLSPPDKLDDGLRWKLRIAKGGRLIGEWHQSQSRLPINDKECVWDQEYDFGVPISESDPTTCLILHLLQGAEEKVLASTTVYLYEEQDHCLWLRQGYYKLRLWPGREADFPFDPRQCLTDSTPMYPNRRYSELGKVEQFLKEYEDGFVEPEAFQETLDPLLIKQFQLAEAEESQTLYLTVQFPMFGEPVRFESYRPASDTSDGFAPDPVRSIWKDFRKVAGEDPTMIEPSLSRYKYLMNLIHKPITWQFTPEHRAQLWKYRYWLRRIEAAMPKFVAIIDWEDSQEVAMVAEVLQTWEKPSIWTSLELMAVSGPFQPDDIDMLWSSAFSRTLATVNEELDDKSLLLFLPAWLAYFGRICRHESYYPDEVSLVASSATEFEKGTRRAVNLLADFLLEQAVKSVTFAHRFFWLTKLKSKEISTAAAANETAQRQDNVYARLLGQLLLKLQQVPWDKASLNNQSNVGGSVVDALFKQEYLFSKLGRLLRDPRLERLTRQQRIQYLQRLTATPESGILSFTPTSPPYDPHIRIIGTLPRRLHVFKSNQMPVRIVFATSDIEEHAIIVKLGEDLRQDAFVLDVLKLIEWTWKKADLDLRMTPYRCASLSLNEGIVEYIPSEPLSHVIAAFNGSIRGYLTKVNSSDNFDLSISSLPSSTSLTTENGTFTEISPTITRFGERLGGEEGFQNGPQPPLDVMETFIRSCAGYCVFTFVLGIGDRHLDNLLISRDGRIFHIDFAYIFGQDPKPFPPPMKICREMVEAMGGPEGALFRRFKSLCFAAFILLRRQARSLIAYVALRAGSNGAQYVHERLMLELNELEAVMTLEQLIDDSINALFPKLMETLHKWAQYWRQ